MQNIFDVKVKDLKGNEVTLENYKGKVLLIVNTASECGLTPQLSALEELYQTYKTKGFEIIAFPCNDFGNQEPSSADKVQEFCETKYNTHFTIMGKVNIKGEAVSEIYQYLISKEKSGLRSIPPMWNFHKYLVDKNGRLVNYFLPITSPTSPRVKKKIEKLLAL